MRAGAYPHLIGGPAATAIVNELRRGGVEPPAPGPGTDLFRTAIQNLSPRNHWPLDEASGPFVDIGSDPSDGSIVGVGVTPQDIAGADGNSYPRIDGVGAAIDATGATTMGPSPTNGGTILGLVYFDSYGVQTCPWDRGECYFSYVSSAGTLRSYNRDSVVRSQTDVSWSASTGQWYFLATRYRAADELLVNIDGAAQSRFNTTVPSNDMANTTETMRLGGYIAATAFRLRGGLAHVAVWDSVLTDGQISDLASAASDEGWI